MRMKIKIHVVKSNCLRPILSNNGPTIKVLIKLDNDNGNMYELICSCYKWNLFSSVTGNL